MYQKGFSNVLIIIFGILIGIAAIGLFTSMKKAPAPASPAAQSPTPSPVVIPTPAPTPAVACGIHVTSPLLNAIVGSTINITGTMDGACHWNAFEATAGNVRAYDANGNPVSTQATLVATTDWMMLPFSFNAQIKLTSVPATTGGYLLFQNDDASGQFPETFTLPIRF